MQFQVLAGFEGWLGGHVSPALGPYTATQQKRHLLARGVCVWDSRADTGAALVG